jgi:hypothetical protein
MNYYGENRLGDRYPDVEPKAGYNYEGATSSPPTRCGGSGRRSKEPRSEQPRITRLPRSAKHRIDGLGRAHRDLRVELGREPTAEERLAGWGGRST